MICEHPQCTGYHTRVMGSKNNRIKVPMSMACPAFQEKKRAKDASHQRKARALKSGKDLTEVEPVKYDNEVKVVPGQCIAWTVRRGHCYNPANGLACVEHKWDFDVAAKAQAQRTRLLPEDVEYLSTLSGAERTKARKRLTSQRMREDPAYLEQENERRRARKLAA